MDTRKIYVLDEEGEIVMCFRKSQLKELIELLKYQELTDRDVCDKFAYYGDEGRYDYYVDREGDVYLEGVGEL